MRMFDLDKLRLSIQPSACQIPQFCPNRGTTALSEGFCGRNRKDGARGPLQFHLRSQSLPLRRVTGAGEWISSAEFTQAQHFGYGGFCPQVTGSLLGAVNPEVLAKSAMLRCRITPAHFSDRLKAHRGR